MFSQEAAIPMASAALFRPNGPESFFDSNASESRKHFSKKPLRRACPVDYAGSHVPSQTKLNSFENEKPARSWPWWLSRSSSKPLKAATWRGIGRRAVFLPRRLPAVLHFVRGEWTTAGRVIFNLSPLQIQDQFSNRSAVKFWGDASSD